VVETWRLGYLNDTIYLRDMFMHRIDAARAVHRPLELTSDHEGRLVADIVREWAGRHQCPFDLELRGPAGGHFTKGGDATPVECIDLDAIEFCRVLAGRSEGTGLLHTIVPF
jgi:hypothetical protein